MFVKRLLILLLIVLSAIMVVSFASAETYTVTTEIDVLNVRSQADGDIIIGGIRAGKKVEIDYHDKYWGYFTYDGIPAKVYFDYLVPASGSSGKSQGTTYTVNNSSKKKETTEKEPERVSIDEADLIFRVSEDVQSHINVRNAKKESAKIIGRLDPGEEVYVVAMGKTWTRIVYNEQYGFVYTKYLVDCGDNLPEEGELYKVKVKKNTTLNVRKESTKKAKVVVKLKNGTYVKLFETDGKWAYICYKKGEFGYVMTKYLVTVEE